MTSTEVYTYNSNMPGNNVFDQLASTLGKKERRELLQKIRNTAPSYSEVLHETSDEDLTVDLDTEYDNLGFIERIVLFIVSLFRQQTLMEALEEKLIKEVKNRIESSNVKLCDFSANQLVTSFYEELKKLANSLIVFKNPMESVFNDHKYEFIAHLAGLELKETQHRLEAETDAAVLRKDHGLDLDQAKEKVDSNLDAIFKEVDEKERQYVFTHMRSFFQLYYLVEFDFESILNKFDVDTSSNKAVCRVADVKTRLLELTDILFTFKLSPPGIYIENLFLFYFREDLEDENQGSGQNLSLAITNANKAMSAIGIFNKNVPMVDLAKYMTKRINYEPKDLGGGEEWFAMFKSFWKHRVDEATFRYIRQEKQKELLQEAADFVDMNHIPLVNYYNPHNWEGDIKPLYMYTLGFVNGVFTRTFPRKMNNTFKRVLIDGDFYKKVNREEFNDAYNAARNIPVKIHSLEEYLSPDGELGKDLRAISKERTSPPLKQKKMRAAMSQADTIALEIIEEALKTLVSLANISKGLLYGESGGKYDTLVNISFIEGGANADFKADLDDILQQLHSAIGLADSLYAIEKK